MATNALPRQEHTAHFKLTAHSRSDSEVTFELRAECCNTRRVCHCGSLDEVRLAERLNIECGNTHKVVMSEGLASRLPGHRKYVEWLRRSDENTWLKAAEEERERDGKVSAGVEAICKKIRERRADAKKAAIAKHRLAKAKAKQK